MARKVGRPKKDEARKVRSYTVCISPLDYKFFDQKAIECNLKFSEYTYLALKFFSLITEEKRMAALKYFRLKSIKDIQKLLKGEKDDETND